MTLENRVQSRQRRNGLAHDHPDHGVRTMASKGMTPHYRVTRFCCTSGQCFDCCRLPYGQRVRLVQYGPTADQAKAKEVAHNWREYGAKVEDDRLAQAIEI